MSQSRLTVFDCVYLRCINREW